MTRGLARPPIGSRRVRRRVLRTSAAALAIAVAAAGCQAGPSPTGPASAAATVPAPSAVPPSAASATAAPSVAATAGASGQGIEAVEVGGVFGVLPPGRYTRRGFEPRITFEVDGPWRAVQKLEGFFDIQQQVGSPDVIAVQFARPTGVVGAGGAVVTPADAEAAVAAIRLNESITVLGSSGSLMDGRQGHVIEVENPATADGDVAVLQVPPGPLGISPSRRLWLAFFDTDDGLLAILVGGSVAKWDEALTTAEPVLETVTIGR